MQGFPDIVFVHVYAMRKTLCFVLHRHETDLRRGTMEDKELKKLSKRDMLEVLVELSEENDMLRKENEELKAKLEDKFLVIRNAGSIAKASLELNGIFEDAQKAADQYISSIVQIKNEKKEELKKMKELVRKLEGVQKNDKPSDDKRAEDSSETGE